MRWFRNLSIRQKLQAIVLITGCAALLVASVIFSIYDRTTFLREATNDLTASAEMIGSNSTAALTFRDADSAREVLSALRAKRSVTHACIYGTDGEVFVKYSRDSAPDRFSPPAVQPDSSAIVGRQMVLFQTVALNGEPVGTIYIEADLQNLHDRTVRFVEIAVLALLISLAAALLLSSRLQRIISGPIRELADTALAVAFQENYSLRAKKSSEDEIGSLFDQFNGMLDRIQQRDRALLQAHDELEMKVAERTSYLNALIENSPLAILVLDAQRRIQYCNPAFENLFQYRREEALGAPIDGLLAEGDLLVEAREAVQKTFEGRAVNLIIRRQRKDRSLVDVEIHTVGLIVKGEVVGSLAIFQDISVRKRTEEQMQRAKEAAEAASRAKSEFLANMSHEIRTPLNGVIGMTDLALDTDLTSEQREYLETVKLSADSLLIVINDVLDFSKIEAGKVDLDIADFDLREALEATLKTLALRADEKGLELLCEVAPEVPEMAKADPTRIRQVVVNLVGNAIKFTEHGEVALKVSIEHEEGPSRIAHFTVTDTGIGIPSEKLAAIFDPFSQADTSTTRKYGGTGLGLTISSRLVAMMGGQIWVESEVGKGSRFHFTIKLETSEKKVEVGAPAPASLFRDVKVLVVDDNRTNQRILHGMLVRWEMRPTLVGSGEEALANLSTAYEAGHPYGLILTDMHMPHMDGFTLVERIRERPELSAATIMMLTSAGHRGDAERCKQLGISAYLLKPIRQSELREAIARVLGAQEQKGAIPLITRFSLHDARDAAGVLRILVAEDNPVNQRLITRLLEKRGHRVVLAPNGFLAVQALEKEAFDLVFMDVQMPEMDGVEATGLIRQKELRTGEHQPIIALTAHAMKGDEEKCLAAGMDGYLSKPIRPQELDKVLDKYVALRKITYHPESSLRPVP